MARVSNNREVTERSIVLAQFLHAFLKDSGIKQRQVAEKLGRAQSYVSDRLLGHVAMDYDTMCAIAELSGISADYLFAKAHDHVRQEMDRRAIVQARP